MPELVHTRVLPVSRERAFEAFSDLERLLRWWGPHGFTSTSEAFDFRTGGAWTMVMRGPDGTTYPNHYTWDAVEAPSRVVFTRPERPHRFEATATLEEAPGGTRLTWRQFFDDEAHFAEVRAFLEDANPQLLERFEAVATGA